ncbi:MAG: HNH endonuclease [Bacteroidetes bacterium]|nr:HNH endonuclease [Bacteroidota bacterium]
MRLSKGGFWSNVGTGFVNKAKGFWNAVTHPVETVTNALSVDAMTDNMLNTATLGMYDAYKDAVTIKNEGVGGLGKIVGGKAFDLSFAVVTDGVFKGVGAVKNAVKGVTAEAGVDLALKPKSTWNADQMAQARAKAKALSDAETVVTKNPVVRDTKLRSNFIKRGSKVAPNEHVDHIVDLQLGGTNEASNLQALDGSVNSSFGKQIQLQIRNLPDGTRVNRVNLLPQKKP